MRCCVADAPGFTCKALTNTYQPRRQVPERIDYVLSDLSAEDCQLALTHTPSGYSYSDHFAVEASLKLSSSSSNSGGGGSALSGSGGGKAKVALADNKALLMMVEDALKVLEKGSFRCMMQGICRLILAAFCIFLALRLGSQQPCILFRSSPSNSTADVTPASCFDVAIFSVQLMLLGGWAASSFIMGFVLDSTQRRCLRQIMQQLVFVAASSQGD